MLEDNTAGRSPFLLTCDHYGRIIPRALGDLGLPASEFERHIAWDVGIAGVAHALSKAIIPYPLPCPFPYRFPGPLPIEAAYRFRNKQGSV